MSVFSKLQLRTNWAHESGETSGFSVASAAIVPTLPSGKKGPEEEEEEVDPRGESISNDVRAKKNHEAQHAGVEFKNNLPTPWRGDDQDGGRVSR